MMGCVAEKTIHQGATPTLIVLPIASTDLEA
jgi:hypothetical protein